MEEEIKIEQTEEVVAEIASTEEPVKVQEEPKTEEVNYEEQAKAKGWKPDGKLSAKEFVDRDPLYEELKSRGKYIKNLERTLEEVKTYMDEQREIGRKQALAELQAQRREAISNGDVEAVDQIEVQLKEYKNPTKIEQPPEVIHFAEKYKNILADEKIVSELKDYDERLSEKVRQGKLDMDEYLELMESRIQRDYSHILNPKDEPKEQLIPTVESSSMKAQVSKKLTWKDLNDEQKTIARDFEKFGLKTRDQYLKELNERTK